uniref:Cytochrome P450 n=1 Tax=Rhodonia placenta TaxID=104341 RepID=F1SY44_9APHY|nr:cytochrome P450 [Postia placenta]
MDPPFISVCLCVFLVSIVALQLGRRLHRFPMPPGPRRVPIIGNALQMPREREWVKFAEWAKAYGGIVHLSVFSTHFIVLSDAGIISELLEKRSAIYSDRPYFPLASGLIGYDKFIILEPYGPRLREGRKLILNNINTRNAAILHPVQVSKMLLFLRKLFEDSGHLRLHVRWLVAAVIFKISHGRDIQDPDDAFVKLVETTNEDFALSVRPFVYLVDSLPFLKYVPEWVPGTGWKSVIRERRRMLHKLRDYPYEVVKQQLAQGTAQPSVTASLIEENPNPDPEEEELQKTSTSILYSAAADTSVSAIESFFLIMTLYPEVQNKAQAELDSVVEAGRLPDYGDRDKLPYIDALIKEVLRWNPVLPLALPHSLMEDDTYRGYHIPKGATVLANSWAVMHDPALYPDPFEVKPERYLSDQGALNPDPRQFAFGYGRRVCPGQLLAEDTLFLLIASVLSTMNITKPIGSDGLPIDVNVEYTSGAISHPTSVQCNVTVRSAESERLILTNASRDGEA